MRRYSIYLSLWCNHAPLPRTKPSSWSACRLETKMTFFHFRENGTLFHIFPTSFAFFVLTFKEKSTLVLHFLYFSMFSPTIFAIVQKRTFSFHSQVHAKPKTVIPLLSKSHDQSIWNVCAGVLFLHLSEQLVGNSVRLHEVRPVWIWEMSGWDQKE
jgi:hypothetical protein